MIDDDDLCPRWGGRHRHDGSSGVGLQVHPDGAW